MYKFTAKEKFKVLKALKITPTRIICRRYKIDRTTLWRWRKQYDGTVKSLEPKFSRKGIHHPNEQTEEEKQAIQNLVRRNPTIGLNELYELNEKYRLRFLNYSTATGCEGLFYKFKVILTDTQKMNILKKLIVSKVKIVR